MPGVVRVFTAADVPGNRGTGLNDPDQPVFVAEGELTCCVADFLAMVVADTAFHARQAAAKVRVDYEVLEPITDVFKALEPGAPLVHPEDTFAPRPSNVLQPTTAFSRGDVDAALAAAAHVIEATFDTQPIDIAFLEPESCLAVPQAGRRRQGPHAKPGIGVRPRADREDPESGSRRRSRSRWPRAAARSARKKSCRFRGRPRWPPCCCSGR